MLLEKVLIKLSGVKTWAQVERFHQRLSMHADDPRTVAYIDICYHDRRGKQHHTTIRHYTAMGPLMEGDLILVNYAGIRPSIVAVVWNSDGSISVRSETMDY